MLKIARQETGLAREDVANVLSQEDNRNYI